MANRRTLHKTHLQEFKIYLQGRGISYREGKGSYQVLQVMTMNKGWKCVYEKNDMKEHFTIQDDLEMLVIGFYSERKEEKSFDVVKYAKHLLENSKNMCNCMTKTPVFKHHEKHCPVWKNGRIDELELAMRDAIDHQKKLGFGLASFLYHRFEELLKKVE